MELYEAIYKRRTVREFLEKDMDFEAIKRILEVGNAAPTWNHNRNWSYIVLHTDEEKEYAFDHAKKIADKFDADKYVRNRQRQWTHPAVQVQLSESISSERCSSGPCTRHPRSFRSGPRRQDPS